MSGSCRAAPSRPAFESATTRSSPPAPSSIATCPRTVSSLAPNSGSNRFQSNTLDVEANRELRLLEAVHEDSRVTQRGLAEKLGIALGLANVYLKRMVHKGYIKCVNVQPNRITYLITPRGITEKARLTYEFMDYSLHLYGEVRQHLRTALKECRE